MIKLINLLSELMEVSPKKAGEEERDAQAAGAGSFTGTNQLNTAQQEKRKQMGVPPEAVSIGFGRWADKQGNMIGKTVKGKFMPVKADDAQKATQRGGQYADQQRTQQARTQKAAQDAEQEKNLSPEKRKERTVQGAAQRLQQSKMGYNPKTGGRSREMEDLVYKLSNDKNSKFPNPNPNPKTEQDKEILATPLEDYLKAAPNTNEREINAAGKANSTYPQHAPHRGAPLGVHTGEDGKKYVMMRAKNIDMYAFSDEQRKKSAQKPAGT
jgi:hypothetical protein